MIRDLIEAAPWPVFVREPWRPGSGGTARGHATVIGRIVQDIGENAGVYPVINYRVRMASGDLLLIAPDQVHSAANIAVRRIAPAPTCIPAIPAQAVRL